jgi:hypothetical protein
MEFLLGFVMAIVAIFMLRIFAIKTLSQNPQMKITYRQSHIYEIIKDFLPDSLFLDKQRNTQSTAHQKSMYTRVVFVGNEAYWIKNNALFVADMEEGIVAEETTRRVDTIGMDKVQLEKVIHIVEALAEGRKNDSGYSGYEGF